MYCFGCAQIEMMRKSGEMTKSIAQLSREITPITKPTSHIPHPTTHQNPNPPNPNLGSCGSCGLYRAIGISKKHESGPLSYRTLAQN